MNIEKPILICDDQRPAVGGHSSLLPRNRSHRAGRTIFAVLCFLTLFLIIVLLVSKFYIEPSMEIAKHLNRNDPQQLKERHAIAAHGMLVMTLLLTLLVIGLLMTFRISRFFFPRASVPRTRTKVIDAWAEAGKRMENAGEAAEEDD